MSQAERTPLTPEELAAETATVLPAKEVMSLLDLNVNLDLALDLASPIDLAVAANANVAAPIDAAVGANILSTGSDAGSLAHQAVQIDQGLSGQAIADAPQVSAIDQGTDTTTPTDGGTTPTDGTGDGGTTTTDPSTVDTSSLLSGALLNVNVDAKLDAHLAAPIDGAVAANANVAAPVDASVSANVGTIDSQATGVADQTAVITQNLDGVVAHATADQQSDINQ
ncbi:MAG TPA: hypothetical protein VF054_20965 [Micromonosporaceae bacterium]